MLHLLLFACAPAEDVKPSATSFVPDPTGPSEPPPTVETVAESALLSSLSIGALTLDPAFASDVWNYDASVLAGTMQVVAIPQDAAAVVSVFGETVDGVLVSEGVDVDLVQSPRVVIEVALGAASSRYEVLALPDGMPDPSSEGNLRAGQVLLGALGDGAQPFVLLTGANGVVRWYEAREAQAYDVRLGPSGHISWIETPAGNYSAQIREPLSWVAEPSWMTAPSETGADTTMNVHEFVEVAEDRAIVLADYPLPMDLSPWGGPVDGAVMTSEFQELDRDGNVLFRWSTDAVFDPDKIEVWMPVDGESRQFDYTHVNSIDVDPVDGNWVISLRLFSQVLKVARNDTEYNGRSYAPGDIIWRLGGMGSDFEFVGDPRAEGWAGFAGQHSARMVGADRVAVFDNALGRTAEGGILDQQIDFFPTGGTRAVEYELDPEAGTATLVWSYEHPSNLATSAGGSVQRLPDGTTLIGWGSRFLDGGGPCATWVSAEGEVTGELLCGDGVWSYRAWAPTLGALGSESSQVFAAP